MAIPAAFQAHFFAENPGPQFVLFAEVHEPNAGPFKLFNQMDHIVLCLVLHRYHADEYLVALDVEAIVCVCYVCIGTVVVQ